MRVQFMKPVAKRCGVDHYLGRFDTDFDAVFSSNSIPRRRRRKNMYTVCQKKNQSRSDYLQARSACYARLAAKLLVMNKSTDFDRSTIYTGASRLQNSRFATVFFF